MSSSTESSSFDGEQNEISRTTSQNSLSIATSITSHGKLSINATLSHPPLAVELSGLYAEKATAKIWKVASESVKDGVKNHCCQLCAKIAWLIALTHREHHLHTLSSLRKTVQRQVDTTLETSSTGPPVSSPAAYIAYWSDASNFQCFYGLRDN